MQPKNEEYGEEEMHKDETQVFFIPSWFLNALDDDFLYGEDIPIIPSPIYGDDSSIDDVKFLVTFEQLCTTLTSGEIIIKETLQISSFPSELETFTFEDIDEVPDQSQMKEDETLSIQSLSYMQSEYEVFRFHEECQGEESLSQENIEGYMGIVEKAESEIYVGVRLWKYNLCLMKNSKFYHLYQRIALGIVPIVNQGMR